MDLQLTSFPQSPRPQARARGFTLVELLAVVAVMVMLLAFTLPILRSSTNTNKTGWDIAGVIEKARAYAQAQNTYVWVGMNMADVSADTRRVVTFVVASIDGTSSTLTTNLTQIDRVTAFDNVSIVAATGANFDYLTHNTTSIAQVTATGPTIALPTTVFYVMRDGTPGKKLLNSSANNIFLRIAPDGSITPTGTTSRNILEIGLQAMRGSSPNEGDNAVIQISSLTGRVKVIRAGSVNPTADPEGEG